MLSLAFASALAACLGSPPTAIPDPATPPPEAEFLLRLDVDQAIPPLAKFGSIPSVVISLGGRVLTGGAVPAIFPGPQVMPIVERQLTARGWARIVAAAREAGLLGERSSFGQTMPGQEVIRLRIVADGRVYDLTAPNTAIPCVGEPCHGAPATREAFMFMVGQLYDLESWLGSDLGDERRSLPAGYAIIVGAIPDDQGLPPLFVDWPFAGGFGAFGRAFADGSGFRCGTILGADAESVGPALQMAKQTTRWRDPVDGSFHGLTVQPLLPGDGDPCAGIV